MVTAHSCRQSSLPLVSRQPVGGYCRFFFLQTGTTDLSALHTQPPFGDVDDRIRAIAHGLGLRTILWQYDSQDWQVDTTPDYTPEMV